MSRGSIVVSILLVLAVGLGWWGYSKLEWVEKSIDLGFNPQARQNPYLAAIRFLTQQNIAASESRRWDSIDALGTLDALNTLDSLTLDSIALDSINRGSDNQEYVGTLIVTSSRLLLGERRQRQIWDWVEKGGHLITHAQSFTDPETGLSKDQLLNKLSLHLYQSAHNQSEVGKTTTPGNRQAHRPWLHRAYKFDENSCPKEAKYLVEIKFRGIDKPITAAFTPGLLLADLSEKSVSGSVNDDGIQMIQYEIDQGMVTVMTDTSLWTNGKIACYDHAYLLWLLTQKSGGVRFLYNAEIASLWKLLWKYAPLVVILSGVWLLLWIWTRSSRFGPMIIGENQIRRELKEHLYASALFLWSHKKYKKLYEPLQNSVLSMLTQRHHPATTLSGNECSEFISQLTHIDPHDVHWAINCQRCEDRITFLRLIQTLQSIRNRL